MNNLINFLKTRRSTTAKTMISGHINESDLNDILACGIRVPDHGALNPWSLTVIKDKARYRIGKEILAPEYILKNPEATEEEIDFEKNRFLRASAVIAVLFKPVSHPKIPSWEMELSTGAVCSNILVCLNLWVMLPNIRVYYSKNRDDKGSWRKAEIDNWPVSFTLKIKKKSQLKEEDLRLKT